MPSGRPLSSILKGGGENGVFSLICNFFFSHFPSKHATLFLSPFDLNVKMKIRLDCNNI